MTLKYKINFAHNYILIGKISDYFDSISTKIILKMGLYTYSRVQQSIHLRGLRYDFDFMNVLNGVNGDVFDKTTTPWCLVGFGNGTYVTSQRLYAVEDEAVG